MSNSEVDYGSLIGLSQDAMKMGHSRTSFIIDKMSTFTIKKTHIGSVYIVSSEKMKKSQADANLPAKLATKQAMGYWQRAQEAGWIDTNYQPLITKQHAALLADYMGRNLNLEQRWKLFEELWHTNTMRKDFDKAMSASNNDKFIEQINKQMRD